MRRAAFDIVMFVASFAIALGMLNMTGCAKRQAAPKQAKVTESVLTDGGFYLVGHIVECDGRRYLLNSAGGIIELSPKTIPRTE